MAKKENVVRFGPQGQILDDQVERVVFLALDWDVDEAQFRRPIGIVRVQSYEILSCERLPCGNAVCSVSTPRMVGAAFDLNFSRSKGPGF